MKKVITTSLVLAAVLLGTAPVFAQSADVSIEARATPVQTRANIEGDIKVNRMEIHSEIMEEREETREEMKEEVNIMREEGAEMRTEMRAEAVATRENLAEERTEAAEERAEARVELQTKVRTMRGDIIMRLANNIVVRLEASVAKLAQISARIETAINDAALAGTDTTDADGLLAASASFLVEAETEIANISVMIDAWTEVDATSETFQETLSEYKAELRASMNTAHEAIRSAGSELRASIQALKDSRGASMEAEVEAEVTGDNE